MNEEVSMGGKKVKQKPESGVTTVSKQMKEFEKGMQKLAKENEARALEQMEQEQKEQHEETIKTFGPPMFHRVLRTVALCPNRTRSRKSSLVEEIEAKVGAEESKEVSAAVQ